MIDPITDQSFKTAYMARKTRLGLTAKPVRVIVARVPVVVPEAPQPAPAPAEWQTEAFAVAVCVSPSPALAGVDPGVWKKNQLWVKIVNEVCADYGVTLLEIKARRRNKNLILARQEAFWRLREETSLSYPAIGEKMGGFDHTTVIHGCTRHEQLLAERAAKAASFPEFMDRKAK